MKYLSVCSGIEAATVAWHSLGWEPLAFSEIEPFPRKVLEYHYPDVPLHGDFTVLRNQDWIKDADILVGGTPCQAFSVAGLRDSLDDDRGNLTLEFVRLADAIDDLRSTGTIIVWENVPGVLSVKDNAFGCFLAALTGNDAPLIPTGGKWTNAGMVVGPKRSAAWRILDAQYFGVAQRRRRVFVVASSRDGFDPAEVLFEREGLRRDSPPSRKKGQEPSATIAARFGISRNNHEEVVAHSVYEMHGQDSRVRDLGDVCTTVTSKYGTGGGNVPIVTNNKSHWDGDEYPHPTLMSGASGTGGVGYSNQEIFSQRGAYLAPYAEVTGPLTAGMSKGLRGTEGIESNWAVVQPITFGAQMSHPQTDIDMVQTLNAKNPMAVSQSMVVRRLTPRECERLQGFPDDYTAIPKAADGPRYKALGNSMAVPVMHWIGRRIKNENQY
jgi:DNA (cytosine-5)-methyltransferase 1